MTLPILMRSPIFVNSPVHASCRLVVGHGNHLTHYQPASYTARRYEFAQSYVASCGSERTRHNALEIVDCGIEPG